MTLTQDQIQANDKVHSWIRSHLNTKVAWENVFSPELTLGGYAGVGKTFLVDYLVKVFLKIGLRVVVLAPTGRAAYVLKRKGVAAATIHSFIYNFRGKCIIDGKTELLFDAKDGIEGKPDLIIVDESSMVNGRMAGDLRKHCIPILWVGDHGQLQPIGIDPGIMRNPEIRLETIMRQAAGNPIIELAHEVRSHKPLPNIRGIKTDTGSVWVFQESSIDSLVDIAMRHDIDQILVARNKLRVGINRLYRRALSHDDDLQNGDRIVCLANRYDRQMFNGMIFTVLQINGRFDTEDCEVCIANIEDDIGNVINKVPIQMNTFNVEKAVTVDHHQDYVPFDFAYAVTAHKAQGSEWPSVMVVDDHHGLENRPGWDVARWRYTACTRAQERLFVAVR